MLTELFSGIMMTLPLLVILHSAQPGVLSSINNCLTGGFFFASGRNMINNYALRGHLLRQMTVTQPIRCFEKCQSDCRCISFNYLTDVNKNNCELNEESRYINFSALKPLEGSQYYDLIVSYDIRVRKAEGDSSILHTASCTSQISKSHNQANKRACIPRTRSCFSINRPSKEVRWSLALERTR